jgi:hypothetical protein
VSLGDPPNAALNYLEVGRWMAAHNFDTTHRAVDRRQIFAAIADEVGAERVLYLEFGVHRGESMRLWSGLLRHPQAMLHGFDSFEGLPEDWTVIGRRDLLDRGGACPQTGGCASSAGSPTRCRLHAAGTAPGAAPRRDLYSSTKTVLDALEREIVRELVFDEFSDLHSCGPSMSFARTRSGAFAWWRRTRSRAVAFERVSWPPARPVDGGPR